MAPKRCVVCGAESENMTYQTHHVNGDHSDNSLKNKVMVCSQCHGKIHWGSTKKTLVWFAKLQESARRRTIPTIGVGDLPPGDAKTFYLDSQIERAYDAAEEVVTPTESGTIENGYCIRGISLSSTLADVFTRASISYQRNEEEYEHRLREVVLRREGNSYSLRLPSLNKSASTSKELRTAYTEFLRVLKSYQGLRGSCGSVVTEERETSKVTTK